MEWILANLKLIIFVVIIVVYVVKALRAKGEAGEDEAGQETRRTLPGELDDAEAERTRQIQEEIRRRILARQRGEAPPQPAADPMEQAPVPPPLPPPIAVPQPVETMEDYYAREEAERRAREAAVLETQRALEEQLRQARTARELATAGVPRLALTAPLAGASRRDASRRSLRDDLLERDSLRRAILLREVLGEPVGLRRGAPR